jgi:hypothetical protein
MEKSSKTRKPEKFEETILLLADILDGYQYAFRGTTSLVLQGLTMNVDDIDLLCDKKTALSCNKLLGDYLVEEVSYKEADKFKSYYGRFKINGIEVEVMGEWQLRDTKGGWSEPFTASEGEKKEIAVDDQAVYVTRIETELSLFAKMGRWNAYHKIKRQLPKEEDQDQLKLLND